MECPAQHPVSPKPGEDREGPRQAFRREEHDPELKSPRRPSHRPRDQALGALLDLNQVGSELGQGTLEPGRLPREVRLDPPDRHREDANTPIVAELGSAGGMRGGRPPRRRDDGPDRAAETGERAQFPPGGGVRVQV